MSPCNPNDISLNVPPGPSGPAIPGFGFPFAPSAPDFDTSMPEGFPEDLLQIFDLLQFILPSGVIKPALNPNFGKDIFDGIMKLLDHFFPFLMLYKFFLPILDLIICIIEVLCAIANPFKLISKLRRLFRTCLPAFLSLFPIFALIVMLLSLLFLIIALIEYILSRILDLVSLLLQNIAGLTKAFEISDEVGILAIIRKLSQILCAFQNLFVLFSLFKTFIDIIKEVLQLFFAIPPCDDGDNGNADKCCDSSVCPQFIRNNETIVSATGSLQYYNRVALDAGLSSVLPSLPAGFLTSDTRSESWQFYDGYASPQNEFYNITSAIDLPSGVNTVFFPTDANYTASTPPNQVPYTVDIRLFYIPAFWNPADLKGPRYIRINNCIVLLAPTQTLSSYNNSTVNISTGVLKIQGGLAFEDDNTTPLNINGIQGTLNTTIHLSPEISTSSIPLEPTDGYLFNNVQYTFHINHPVLLSKALITLGCVPDVALDRTFTNTFFGGNAGVNFTLLNNLVNSPTFPDPGAAQQCMATALAALRSNMGPAGVATFQATTTACLTQLQDNANTAINTLLGIGFDQYQSTFTLSPNTQFTTQQILVQVALKETNGQSLTAGMPASSASSIASRIQPIINFGSIDNFVYDGVQFFIAHISSTSAGTGTIKIAFDGKVFSTINLPTDVTQSPSVNELVLPYTFVFSPGSVGGDTDGKPRFTESDVADATSKD